MKTDPERWDAIVIGAGPAGLMAAGECAARGGRVLVLEQMQSPGRKLLVTGGGRCNLTNQRRADEIAAAFGRNGRFALHAISRFDPAALRRFMEDRGVRTVVEEGGCVFPAAGKAASVLEALLSRARDNGVVIRSGCRAGELLVCDSRIRGVETQTAKHEAHAVVIATGGRSYPGLGGTGGGYAMAIHAGHALIPQVPALVPLVVADTWPGPLAGVSLPCVELRVEHKARSCPCERGPLLFTHEGLSGPAALNLSGAVAELLEGGRTVALRLNPIAGESAESWTVRLDGWRRTAGRRTMPSLLRQMLPASLAGEICVLAGLEAGLATARMGREQMRCLVRMLAALELTVKGTGGFAKAMVTRGGVSLDEVRPDSLESRLVKGLYFAGEVLDLAGPCGGFNLQWAFSSGMTAGAACAESAGLRD